MLLTDMICKNVMSGLKAPKLSDSNGHYAF
jgi:hypothetical protein